MHMSGNTRTYYLLWNHPPPPSPGRYLNLPAAISTAHTVEAGEENGISHATPGQAGAVAVIKFESPVTTYKRK